MSVPAELSGFTRLNSAVYLYAPIPAAPPPSFPKTATHPSLIILLTWLNARPAHIAKYVAGYKRLNPSAQILVITATTWDVMFNRGVINNLDGMRPVLDILDAAQESRHRAKVLLHLFSNGGTLACTLLAKTYAAKYGKAMPVSAMVLDSAPGKLTYWATVRAFAIALPRNRIFRAVGLLLVHVAWSTYCILKWLAGRRDRFESCRTDLITEGLFSTAVPRLYVYSVADRMVNWQFVEENAADAERMGYVVVKEKFLDSAHATHLAMDEERYWNAVLRIWKMASDLSQR